MRRSSASTSDRKPFGSAAATAPTRLFVSLAFLAAALALAPAAHATAPPQIDATWATAVTVSSANLHAEVNPEGLATTYRFEYLTEAAYQANGETFAGAAKAPAGAEASLGQGSTDAEALQHLAGLKASTTYRYRIVAHNSAGTETGPEPAHAFTTEPTGASFALLDQRGWEMVSPIEKNGGAIQGAGANSGGDVLQAAAQGGAITYSSASSFGTAPQGAPPASQYLSRRSQAGWSTENITTPSLAGSYGNAKTGVPYQLFSTDLARGLLLNGRHCRGEGEGCPVANPPLAGSGAPAGYQDYYLRDDEGGGFQALLSQANDTELALSPEAFDLTFAGASPDLRHVVLATCAKLTPEASEAPLGEGCDPAEANLYEWSEGQLRLINLLPGEVQGTPGAALAATAGAVSADGSRVYFTEEGNLYLREGSQTAQVDEEEGGGGQFQAATPDGSFAFFTKAGHLYRYEAEYEDLSTIDLTPAGEVKGVLGVSADGSRAYYETAAGLFLWHAGTTTEVAAAADPSNYPPATGTARTSPDGSRLAFLSKASLTGYDNTDQHTGEPDSEVYLYEAPAGGGGGTLTCVSCNPTGERPLGPSTIPGAIANGDLAEDPTATDSYKPRDLSTDGTRLFFDSADALVPFDTNNRPDAYEWEAAGVGSCQTPGGCIDLLSSGRSGEAASFIDASADGADAFFLSGESLVPSDPGSVDVYDAREGGGFPVPSPPIACEGDACQPLPSAPEDPTPGTLVSGPGNLPVHFPEAHHHHKKHKHHKHKPHGRAARRRGGRG